MPVSFGLGSTVAISLKNKRADANNVMIQRFASDGRLMDSMVKQASGETVTEVRLDVSPISKVDMEQFYPVLVFVTKGMPADKAGLRKGDTLISMNGKPMHHVADMPPHLREFGKPVEIVYKRDGITNTVVVVPEHTGDGWLMGIQIMDQIPGTKYDLSMGWLRVVQKGSPIDVSAVFEQLNGDKLQNFVLARSTKIVAKDLN
jgi:membrane-associated protease RseP (regulator of RpoE activity)